MIIRDAYLDKWKNKLTASSAYDELRKRKYVSDSELEDILMKDIGWTFLHARDNLRGPFHRVHPVIFNSNYKDRYINFLKEINYDLSEIGEYLI